MLTVRNNADTVEIDVFGDIGEGWFSEGNTLESVKAQVPSNAKSITVNIDSLGGDLSHGLAIHDMLKNHSAKVTANIMGWTASAGTIIAMGADEVHANENQFFLIHPVWTMAVGNADELRAQADELDRFDKKLVNIYENKTDMSGDEIMTLMREERWMDMDEAKELGFIDEINTTEIANSVDFGLLLNKVEGSNLPKPSDSMKKQIKNKSEMQIDETKVAEGIFAKLTEFFTKEDKTVADDVLKNAAEAQAKEIKEAFETSLTEAEDKMNAHTTEVDALKAELATAKTSSEDLQKEVDVLKAKGTDTTSSDEGATEKVTPEHEATWAAIRNLVKKTKQVN